MYIAIDTQKQMQLNDGSNLFEYSLIQPVLLIFLRHFGCVFCKEAMTDISALKESIFAKGVKIVFVHMAENKIADTYFKEFNLSDCKHISDTQKKFYRLFGLRKGSFTQLYGMQTWVRGFAPENKKHKLEVSKSLGDATQMPGIFHINEGIIQKSFIHNLASEKPDYLQMADCCLVN